MNFYEKSWESIAVLFKAIPGLKVIEMRIDRTTLVSYGILVFVGVKSINGESLYFLNTIHDGDVFLNDELESYQSFLVAANLKADEVRLIANTLKTIDQVFLTSKEVLKREDFIKENV